MMYQNVVPYIPFFTASISQKTGVLCKLPLPLIVLCLTYNLSLVNLVHMRASDDQHTSQTQDQFIICECLTYIQSYSVSCAVTQTMQALVSQVYIILIRVINNIISQLEVLIFLCHIIITSPKQGTTLWHCISRKEFLRQSSCSYGRYFRHFNRSGLTMQGFAAERATYYSSN